MAGQMILLLILSLIATQIISLALFFDERRTTLRLVHREQVIARTAAVLRLLTETPSSLRDQIVQTASAPGLHFSLGSDPSVTKTSAGKLSDGLEKRLDRLAPGTTQEVRLALEAVRRPWLEDWWDNNQMHRRHYDDDEDDDHDEDDGFRHGYGRKGGVKVLDLSLSARLLDGNWLNVKTEIPRRPQLWLPLLASLGLAAAAIAVVVIIALRRITRPLNRLAAAADRLGRGQAVENIPESGPDEIRKATAAFNQMRDRLDRFIADRTRLLAAISHDLRTPITSLRLRAEFIEDPAIKEKMLETLEEMQQMAEAALAFAREETAGEGLRKVDLFALLDSIAEDLRDMGQKVTMRDGPKALCDCRPVSLKRALRNIIENGATYGGTATIQLTVKPKRLCITVEDEGPGISEENLERVFDPFVRLEESRNRETGGVGLGLSIARSIIRRHGGDVKLANRGASGGLRVTITLPATAPMEPTS